MPVSVAARRPREPPPIALNPETERQLEECRAKIELLQNVTEERLRSLSRVELVGVVGDLFALAARSEYERERRFREATRAAAERTAAGKTGRARAGASSGAPTREELGAREVARWEAKKREARETVAAVRIQRHARGYLARAFIAGKKAAMERAAAAEREARESKRIRESAAVTIQSRMARLRRASRDQRGLAPTLGARTRRGGACTGGGGGFTFGVDADGERGVQGGRDGIVEGSG